MRGRLSARRIRRSPSERRSRPCCSTARSPDPKSGGGTGYRRVTNGVASCGWSQPREQWVEVFEPADEDGNPLPLGAAFAPVGESRRVEVHLAPERTIEGQIVDGEGRGL